MSSAFKPDNNKNAAKEILQQLISLYPAKENMPEKYALLFDQLQAELEKLENENRELSVEKTEIKEDLLSYTELFDASPLPQMIVSKAGYIVKVNDSLCELIMRDKSDLLGNKFGHFLETTFDEVYDLSLKHVFENEKQNSCELKAKGPKEVWVQIISKPYGTGLSGEPMVHSVIYNISNRKARETDLLRLSAAFEQSANSIFITDTDGNIQYANPRFYEVTGYTAEEAIGQNPRILKYEKSIINYKELWETISGGNTWTGEFLNKAKSGKLFWEIGTITPVKDAKGNIINYLAIKEDITERKEAEQKLVKAKEYYLNLLQDFPVMVWQCDKEGRFNFYNKTLISFAGWDPKALDSFNHFFSSIHPHDRPIFEDAFQKSLKGIKPFVVEFRLKDSYDEYRWVMNHGKPFTDLDGSYGGFMGSCIDIHDRIKTEQKLVESEDTFRRMFEDSSLGIFRLDRRFNLSMANKAFAAFFGFTNLVTFLKEINKEPEKYFPAFANKKVLFKDILKSAKNRFTIEEEFKDKNGNLIHGIIYLRKVNPRQKDKAFYIEGFLEDITHRKLVEKNLSLSEQKFRSLFDKSYDAILILDGNDIVDCNLKAGVLLKTPCSKLQGTKLLSFCAPKQYQGESSENFIAAQMKAALDGTPVTFDLLMLRGNKAFDAEVSFTRLFFSHKAMIQAIIRDVSKKRTAEKQLNQAKDDAEKARKAQSEFLSLMSHEIRTPLNAVVSLTDLLLQDELNKEQLENLNSVKVSARHLLSLIDDILDYNKIESGNIQFESHDFDLRFLVEELSQTLGFKAREKGLKFSVQVHDNVPKVLIGDTLRLKQVLYNLLSNGIKFTEEGSVNLTVKNQPGSTKGIIQFEVQDTGIGILKDRLDAIFEKFTQAETSTTRKYGGSGLGLAVCKKLIELQGGEISAQSTPGKGSVFTFYLPMTEGSALAGLNNGYSEASSVDTLQGMHILMVEDDKMNQFVGQRVLAKKGKALLTIASTGEEALALLENNDYDLILMDLLLPNIDGCQLTQMIRNNEAGKIKNPKIPIIALTADAFLETRKKAFDAGVNDFVTKPFDFLKLFKRIIKYRSH
jgi:PAS domain S-box-containing protein